MQQLGDTGRYHTTAGRHCQKYDVLTGKQGAFTPHCVVGTEATLYYREIQADSHATAGRYRRIAMQKQGDTGG